MLIKIIFFAMILKNLKVELFILCITQIIEINFIISNNFNNIIDSDFFLIFEKYHEFTDIFNRKKVNKLSLY